MEIYYLDFTAYFRKHFPGLPVPPFCKQGFFVAFAFFVARTPFHSGEEVLWSSLLQSPAPLEQRQLREPKVCRVRSQFPKWPCKPSKPDGGRKENWYRVNSAQTQQVNIKSKYSLSSFSFLKTNILKNFLERNSSLEINSFGLYFLMKISRLFH